jgi:hypothetical protein
MLRTLFILLFLSSALFSSAQSTAKTEVIKVSESNVKQIKSVQDLITSIPKNCKIKSYTMTLSANGSVKEMECQTNAIEMAYRRKGDVFFIEKILSDCPSAIKKTYKIIISE